MIHLELSLFVLKNDDQSCVPISATPATEADFLVTKGPVAWQTDWTSAFIAEGKHKNIALKTPEGELIALACYEVLEDAVAVYIAYAESAPESNPTMTKVKKYNGIGKAVIAFGVALSVNHGFGGTVFFEAKTSELARHYLMDFGAMPLPSFGGPQRFIVDREIARDIITDYLK